MRIIYIILTFFIVTLVEGVDMTEEAKKAEAFFDAGEYSQAKKVYEQLLKQELSFTQKLSAKINLGAILVAEEDFPEALKLFNGITLPDDPPPYIASRLYVNKSIALLNQSLRRMEKPQEQDFKSIEESIKDLKEALKSLDSAFDIDKELVIIEGRDIGEQSQDLKKIQGLTKCYLAELLKRKRDYWFANIQEKEALPILYESLIVSIKKLESLSKLEKAEIKRYLKNLYTMLRVHNMLWDKLKEKYAEKVKCSEDESKIKEAQQKEKFFYEVENLYCVALDYMKDGKIWDAHSSINKSIVFLDLLICFANDEDPIDKLLINRIVTCDKIMTMGNDDARLNSFLDKEYLQKKICISLVNGLEKAFSEEMQSSPQDDDKKLSIELLTALTHRLEDAKDVSLKQAKEVKESTVVKQATEDLFSYRQIFTQEEDSFMSLCNLLAESDINDNLFLYLSALNNKFKTRKQVVQDVSVREKIDEVTKRLDYAISLEKASNIDDIIKNVDEAFMMWNPQKYIISKLYQLEKAYKAVSESLDKKSLEELITKAQVVLQQIEETQKYDQDIDIVREELLNVLNDTLYSINQISQQKMLSAKLYFDDAIYWISRILHRFDKKNVTLKEKLEEGIMQQYMALGINKQLQDIDNIEELSDGLINLLVVRQRIILEDMSSFEDTNKDTLDSCKDKSDLWDQVVELVKKGIIEAEFVEKYILLTNPEFSNAKMQQENAIHYWKEALDKLTNNNVNNEQKEQDGTENKQNIENGDNFAQTVELYQSMERDDNIKKSKNSYVKKGLRPW